MYEQGRGGLIKDETQAVTLYRLAADQGYASGRVHLASMYERGTGIGKNLDEAKRLYELAAKQGNEFAERALKRLADAAKPQR
jgi:TPR repeat protein